MQPLISRIGIMRNAAFEKSSTTVDKESIFAGYEGVPP